MPDWLSWLDALFVYLGVATVIILWEIKLGIALIGLSGERPIIEKEKSTSAFWFVIMGHALVFVLLPILIRLATS